MIELAFVAAYIVLLASLESTLGTPFENADLDQLKLDLDMEMQDLVEHQEAHKKAVDDYKHFRQIEEGLMEQDPALDALCDNLAARADYSLCLTAIKAHTVERIEREIARVRAGQPSEYTSLFSEETAPLQERALQLDDKIGRLERTFKGLVERGVRLQDDRAMTVMVDQTHAMLAATDLVKEVCRMEGIRIPVGLLPGPVRFER